MHHRVSRLPEEILWNVAHFLTLPCPGWEDSESAMESFEVDYLSKPPWTDVNGFLMASKALRDILLRNWFHVLHIRSNGDFIVYREKYPFVFSYTTAIVWHGAAYGSYDTEMARTFFASFAGRALRSVRLVLPVPESYPLDTELHRTHEKYLEAIKSCTISCPPSRTPITPNNANTIGDTDSSKEFPTYTVATKKNTITRLEIYNELYPAPDLARLIVEALPQLEELKLRQPSMWCNSCFTCTIPRFSGPLPFDKVLVYPDGRGLPAHWSSRLSVLPNLHRVSVTVGAKRSPQSYDFSSFPSSFPDTASCSASDGSNVFRSFPWTGECKMCLLLMGRDPTYLEITRDKKVNNGNIPRDLKRVEWRFVPMHRFGEESVEWSRIARYLYD